MRIDRGAHALGFIARLAAPALPVADEETLIGREVVERLQILSLCIYLPRHVREQEATEIGYVLAQRQLAVDLDVVDDRVTGILI